MKELLDTLNAISPLSPELQIHLQATIKVKEYPKDSFLLKAGRTCENICFIHKGLVRVFYENDDIEICPWLLKEGDIAISVASFFRQAASFESIQAIEDTFVYYLTYNELQSIYDSYAEFNFVGRELLQYYYVMKELRSFSTFSKSADERYKYLLQFYADLIPRIPDKYLAAYLGMDPSTFCRSKSKYFKDQITK